MQIVRVRVRNFRGIAKGEVKLDGHTVLVGDNNAGKSTLLEAIDLVLGPERLVRRPVVDEHDFHGGVYLTEARNEAVPIQIEVVVTALSEDQQTHFRDHLEWWDSSTKCLIDGPPAAATGEANVLAALRVFFNGWYDFDEDDFAGDTFYALPENHDGGYTRFTSTDKRRCGFLYLRTLRTGARALSLERGSLLDVILRLQDTRVKMWEQLLSQLRQLPVGEKEEIGTLLERVQDAIRQYLPADGAENPHMRVSDLTREMLRRTLTVFMGTAATQPDGTAYAAPYQHQGTGTINTLVLALLSIIAELKQSVIFAMEEPEIALPPHTQKRIINSVRQKSSQAIFTSHSPYVLEEFEPNQIRVLDRTAGTLKETPAAYPPGVKPKKYRTEFRTRFCEALLAKYVLIVEGKTEFDALPAAARRLCDLEPGKYKALEHLGVATIDAEGEDNVAPLGKFFRSLGKTVFAVFDKREKPDDLAAVTAAVDRAFESPTKGFESLVLNQTPEALLRNYALAVVSDNGWPPHMVRDGAVPTADTPLGDLRGYLMEFFRWGKGRGTSADLLTYCSNPTEMPQSVREALASIAECVEPRTATAMPAATPFTEAAVPVPAATENTSPMPAAGGSEGKPASSAASPDAGALPSFMKFNPRPPE